MSNPFNALLFLSGVLLSAYFSIGKKKKHARLMYVVMWVWLFIATVVVIDLVPEAHAV